MKYILAKETNENIASWLSDRIMLMSSNHQRYYCCVVLLIVRFLRLKRTHFSVVKCLNVSFFQCWLAIFVGPLFYCWFLASSIFVDLKLCWWCLSGVNDTNNNILHAILCITVLYWQRNTVISQRFHLSTVIQMSYTATMLQFRHAATLKHLSWLTGLHFFSKLDQNGQNRHQI